MTTSTSSTGLAHRLDRDRLFTPAFVRLSVGELAYFTAAGVAIYALPPYAGRLSDRVGRRPLLVGGALLAAVMMVLTAFADTLPLVVALRLGVGVAEAAFFVAVFAALADLAPPSRIGEALSYNSLGLYLGITLGPPLGELLVRSFGFTAAWYGAAVLLVLAATIIHGIGETLVAGSPRERRAPLIHWKAVPPALGFLTSVVAMGGFLGLASLHADAVGVAGTSLPLTLYGVVVVLCRVAFAKVPDRLPALPLGAAALATIATGLALAALWTTPVGFLLGAALLGVGVSFSTPAFFTAIFATASPSERGAASGTASVCLDLGLGGGTVLLALLADGGGIPGAFAVAAGVAGAGCAWTLLLARHTARPPVTRRRGG